MSQLNTYTQEIWTAAVEQFEQKLRPTEDLIVGKLRNLINRKKSNTVDVRNIYFVIFNIFQYISNKLINMIFFNSLFMNLFAINK